MITHTVDQLILDPKSKQDKVKVTNLDNLPKLQFFAVRITFTRDTPEIAWQDVYI